MTIKEIESERSTMIIVMKREEWPSRKRKTGKLEKRVKKALNEITRKVEGLTTTRSSRNRD